MRALAVSSALAAAGCDAPTEAPSGGAAAFENIEADNVMYDMVSYLSAAGVREGRVRADSAYVFADSAKIILFDMEVVFYAEDGRERATVQGRAGEMDENTDAMVARGDVVLTLHADGRRLESSEIHYDPVNDRIWSDSATVQTTVDGRVTRGSAFESDMEFRNVNIRNPRGSIGQVSF
jgi:LPS export ABC transporter protein LptC